MVVCLDSFEGNDVRVRECVQLGRGHLGFVVDIPLPLWVESSEGLQYIPLLQESLAAVAHENIRH